VLHFNTQNLKKKMFPSNNTQQNNNNIKAKQQQADRDEFEREKRRQDTMVTFLRTVNNAVKYIVVFIVFVICVTKTYPGEPGVLPAYFLISSLFLAATVKVLKKILKQPRPEPEQCEYHPKKFAAPVTPSDIVVGGSNNDKTAQEEDENENEDFDDNEAEEEDDHGMPSSHSAMLSYFSWTANFALVMYDAFRLTSRAWSGLFGVFLPLLQLFFEGNAILGLMNPERQSEIDKLAASNTRHSEALSFVIILLCLTSTIFLAGVFGSQLRVWNGDHTIAQALVGYILGFFWACATVVLEGKIFQVNSQSVNVQWIWFGMAIILGLIGGFLILRKKNKNRLLLKKRKSSKRS
jgi:hypothetical protein